MIINLKVSVKKTANICFRIKAKMKGYLQNKKKSIYETPILINNYNRLEYLKDLIAWLESAGMKRIYIIDNLSTYPPLLDFYKNTKYTVFKLDENVGHEALWKTHLQMLFCKNYYIYTDPDLIPIKECPLDFIKYFYDVLDKNLEYDKVGFSLKIDDIPDYYEHKQKVLDWENQYWQKEISKNLYHGNIDTTFALYRPNTYDQRWDKAIRTGSPYMMRHLPWYLDKNNLPDEEKYYKSTALDNISSWNNELLNMTK